MNQPAPDLEGLRTKIRAITLPTDLTVYSVKPQQCIGDLVGRDLEDQIMRLVQAEVAARKDEHNRYHAEVMACNSESTPGVDDLIERGYLENYHEDRLAQLSRPPQQTHGKEDKPNGEV